MKYIVRLTALVVVALSLAGAPRSSFAGADATRTASNCYFVRHNLPCPCPNARQARAVAHAASITAGALGDAFGRTVAALAHTERHHDSPADARKATPPAQPRGR
jgi:hypothetical protein